MDGNVLSYTAADGGSEDLSVDSSLFSANTMAGLESGFGQGLMMPGMFGMGFGDPFRGGFMRGEFGGGEGGARPDFTGHFPDGGDHFEHGRPGFGMYRASANLRVSLDNPSRGAQEKPVITAVGVDPQTQDVWTAVGDTLVHLDSSGNRLDMYYLAISDGASLKPASILVEADRILIASDPWGVYEFPRPDKPSQSPPPLATSHLFTTSLLRSASSRVLPGLGTTALRQTSFPAAAIPFSLPAPTFRAPYPSSTKSPLPRAALPDPPAA